MKFTFSRGSCVLGLAAALLFNGGAARAESATTENALTIIKLSDYVCTDEKAMVNSFGVQSCDAYKTDAKAKLAAATRHVLANLYDGIQLQADFRTPTATNGVNGFCRTIDPLTAKPLTFPVPLCNIGDPSLDESDINHLDAKCGTVSPAPYADSNGLCDFYSLALNQPVDLEKMCPKEMTWLKSLRPQAFQAAYEEVAAELDGGQLTLTTVPGSGGVTPCAGLGRSVDRIVSGAKTGGPLGVPSLKKLRAEIKKSNDESSADDFKFDEKSSCTGDAAQKALDGNSGTTYSILACQLLSANRYVEFLISQAAICEVNVRGDAKYFNTLPKTAGFFKGVIQDALEPCKVYATAEAGLGPHELFWTNAKARTALYKCYNSGQGTVAPHQHKGVQDMYRNWVRAQIPVKTGLAPFAKILGNDGKPVRHPACALFLMPALPFWRRRKRTAAAKLLLTAALVCTLAWSGNLAQASGTATIVKLACPGGGNTESALDTTCVCSTKREACHVKADADYEQKKKDLEAAYDHQKAGEFSDWGLNKDCHWDSNPLTSNCKVSCEEIFYDHALCHCHDGSMTPCKCSRVVNSAMHQCELDVWLNPETGRDRINADKAYAALSASCNTIYAGSSCDQGGTMENPEGDTNTFTVGMQGCLEDTTEKLPADCPPAAPDPQVTPPIVVSGGEGEPENAGESAMVGAGEMHNSSNVHVQKIKRGTNNNSAAATAADGPQSAVKSKSKGPTALKTSQDRASNPTTSPRSVATLGGGAKTNSGLAGFENSQSGNANNDDNAPNNNADAATAQGAGGFETAGGGGGSGRSGTSHSDGVAGRGSSEAGSFATTGIVPNADGSVGPRDFEALTDGREPYLLAKGVSIFEVVNRRYKKKTGSMLKN